MCVCVSVCKKKKKNHYLVLRNFCGRDNSTTFRSQLMHSGGGVGDQRARDTQSDDFQGLIRFAL